MGKMSVSIYSKGYYEDFGGFWRQKKSQFKAKMPAFGPEILST